MKSTSRSRKTSPAGSRSETPATVALTLAAEDLGLAALEERVQSAIGEIERLRIENAALRSKGEVSAGDWVREREDLRRRVSSLVAQLEVLARVEDGL